MILKLNKNTGITYFFFCKLLVERPNRKNVVVVVVVVVAVAVAAVVIVVVKCPEGEELFTINSQQ